MSTLIAYVHYSAGPMGPFQTVNAPCEIRPLWWMERGLSFTSTGYGSRIPTRYVVNVNGRWRRVYCCQWSNVGTCYIEDRSEGKKPHPVTGKLCYPWIVVRSIDPVLA